MENTAAGTKLNRVLINPVNIIEIMVWLTFIIGIFLKCSYFQFSNKLNFKPYFSQFNNNMFLSTLSAMLLLSGVLLLIFNRKRLLALLISDFILSILLLADTLYFRYYYNAITIPVFYQIGLASSITESIKSLFKLADIIFIVDLPFFAAGFVLIRKVTVNNLQKIKPLKRIITSVVTICISFALFHTAYSTSSPAIFPYDNNYVINDLGILYFHYYDVKRHVEERFFTDHTLKAEEKAELDSFFSARKSSGDKYKGIARDKNLIIVQMEAIQQFLINSKFNGREITPNLNKFIDECTYLDNFYYQVGTGNTSDAEFLANNSLYPLRDGSVYFKYPTNTYESLPKYLKQQGYSTYVFHANSPSFWNRTEMYKAVGFDKFINSNDFKLDERLGWGLSDKSFFRQSLEKIDTSKPFYGFFITLSSHHPYNYFKDYNGFDVGNYEDTMAGNYVKAANYVDQAIGQLFEDLKKRGLYDDSVIIIYGDHHSVPKDQTDMLKDLFGFQFSEYNWTKIQKTPCFIKFPGMQETGINKKVFGEIDILPTIANLMGFEAPYAMGKDIFNTEKGYAVLRSSSVVTDDYTYVVADDTVYDNDGLILEKDKYKKEIENYQHELDISDIILNKNALGYYNKK